jgi:peptide/nickel transport system substrate-binding protein
MKKVVLFLFLGLMVSASIFAAGINYGGTLNVIMPWGQLTDSVNPFLPTSQTLQMQNMIYEGLFYVNALNGELTPMLGTSYKWSNDNLTLTVNVRNGVKWSDGQPFTSNDVAFTFNLIKKYPALDLGAIWAKDNYLQSVEASGDTVVFTFSKPNTPLLYSLFEQLIVPEHLWANIQDPSTYPNQNPVGTGPFLLDSFNPTTNTITLVKNPNYWMVGRPYIDKIVVRSVESNTTVMLELLRGSADWSYVYIPGVQQNWINKDPQYNKIWWPMNSTLILYLNTQKYPFNNPVFRQAISMAIDRAAAEEKAYFDAGKPSDGLGLLPSQNAEWLDPTLTNLATSLGQYDPQKAQELLASIGFKKNADGNLVGPDGKVLPTYKLPVVAGWTDYLTISQIIAQNLKDLGINAIINQESFGSWWSTITRGMYDMAFAWSTGAGPTPYFYFNQELNPAFAAPLGQTAASDWSGYTNPLITAALSTYAQTSDLNLQKQAIYSIERIFLEEMPFVPVVYGTEFDVFSEHNFVGWPSTSNPYASGAGIGSAEGEMIALNIHLR